MSGKKPPLLILLHGVGSNEEDLFRFAPQLDEHVLVLSPRAPLTLQAGSYAWLHVDFSTGQPVIVVQEAEESRQRLSEFIDEAVTHYGGDSKQVLSWAFRKARLWRRVSH
jgi:phospholipase/carboxylesterase